MQLTLSELYHVMYQEMGPQGWWPAKNKFEIIVGAILVQNTNWTNVDHSLDNLRRLTDFQPENLAALDNETLREAIHPSGFYKNKSRSLQEIFQWLKKYNYDFEKIRHHYGKSLRNRLLRLFGIGNETADALLLYVFDIPTFIADSYTRRIFQLLGAGSFKNYQTLYQKVQLPCEFSLADAQEFHGLLDNFGKVYSKSPELFAESFLANYQLVLSEEPS